ncbi:MAG: transcription termination/antitermination protein NusA [Clostridia bacterium]|nr:transcription termination/antitermination protein NusA [Clostridia bacterium]
MKKANAEFFEAIRMLEKEKGIPGDYLMEKIQAAIIIAVKRDFSCKEENILIVMEPETNVFYVAIRKTVVDEVLDPEAEILREQAVKYKKSAKVGDVIEIPLETKQFGRIAAQIAKHVIRQGIREAERGQQLQEFQRKNQELVTAIVTRVDPNTGAATLEIGHSMAVLPRTEQLETDRFRDGDRIKVFVVDVKVKEDDRGPRMMLSRTHPGMVKRLFEMEVPEIYNGTVEIKAVSREAGSRTKLAVYSADENVDPIGACIGPHGSRVAGIVDELGGEKIDIVRYSDQPEEFISAALSPAKVIAVEVAADGSKACQVTVPENQLSLAIGNKGQNVRLAARLTGWKIDIHADGAVQAD